MAAPGDRQRATRQAGAAAGGGQAHKIRCLLASGSEIGALALEHSGRWLAGSGRQAICICTVQAPAGRRCRKEMGMQAKIFFITLAVADLGRSVAFYRDGLGWPTEGIAGQEFHDEVTSADATIAIFHPRQRPDAHAV
jgi:hypothetical protein